VRSRTKFKSAFEGKSILVALDADVLDDLRALKMEKGVAKIPETYKGNRGRDGGQRHGDSAIALAMAWHAITSVDAGPLAYGGDDPEDSQRLVADSLRRGMRKPAGIDVDEEEETVPKRLFSSIGRVVKNLTQTGRV
jgi:hypothetical protein